MELAPDIAADQPVPTARKRVLAYDALRLFSILTVVLIHCFMPLRGRLAPTAPALVIDDVLHYAVPVFVFISGALLWARPLREEPGAYRSFMAKRLKVVGVPYLFWALVFLGLAVTTAVDPLAKLAQAPGLLLSGHIWYHLYFIPMLITFYALTPLAARSLKWSPEATLLAAYALRLLIWPLVSPVLREGAPPLFWSWSSHVVAHLPHMALGAWFVLRLKWFPRWLRMSWPVLLVYGLGGLTAISLGHTASWPVLLRRAFEADAMAGLVLGLMLAALELEPLYARFERTILSGAALSFGVYFVHPLVLETLTSVAKNSGLERLWFEWWAVPVAFAIISTVSFGAARLMSRSAMTAWLVGTRTGEAQDKGRA